MPQGMMPAYEFLERTERLLEENPEQLYSSLKKLVQEVKDRLVTNGTRYLEENQEDIDKLKEKFIEQKEEIKYLSDEVWDLEEEVATLKKNNLQLSKKLETKENQ
jgi:cbb3-type cytochrome oxidase cytochrome c subunit